MQQFDNPYQQRTEKSKAYDSMDSDIHKSIGRSYTFTEKPSRILNFYKQKKLDYDADLKDEASDYYQSSKFKDYKKDLRKQEVRNSSPTRKFNEFYQQYTDKKKKNLIGKSSDGKQKFDYSAQIVVRKFHEKLYSKNMVS